MSMQIMCAKGCGQVILVTDEIIEEAKKHSAPINVSHEVCPTEPTAPMRGFKIVISVSEMHPGEPLDYCTICGLAATGTEHTEGSPDEKTYEEWVTDGGKAHEAKASSEPAEERVASMGAEVEAGSFTLAIPKLQEELNAQWNKIMGMAPMIDEG